MLDFSNTGSWLLEQLSFQLLIDWSTDDRQTSLAIGNHALAEWEGLLTPGLKLPRNSSFHRQGLTLTTLSILHCTDRRDSSQKRKLPKKTAAINSDPKQDSALLFWRAERQLSSIHLAPKPPSLNRTTVFYSFTHMWAKQQFLFITECPPKMKAIRPVQLSGHHCDNLAPHSKLSAHHCLDSLCSAPTELFCWCSPTTTSPNRTWASVVSILKYGDFPTVILLYERKLCPKFTSFHNMETWHHLITHLLLSGDCIEGILKAYCSNTEAWNKTKNVPFPWKGC